MKKILLSALLSTIAAVSVFPTFAQEKVELRMSWWGGNSRHQATLKAIEAFQKTYPDIKVKAEYTGWDGHLSRLSTQIASGTEPDVMQTNWPWLSIFSKNGDGYYDLYSLKENIDLSQFTAKDLQSTSVNGKLNGIPISVNAPVFYYNEETWKKAGLTYPKTWDELFASGKLFKEKLGNNYYPLVMVDQDVMLLLHTWMMQKYNVPMFDSQTGKLGWNKAQIIEAFAFMKKITDEHVLPSSKYMASFGKGDNFEMKPWINGEWGGVYTWNISIRMYIENMAAPAKLVLGPYPMLPGATDSGIYFKTAQMLSVGKASKHPKEAATLINFLLNNEQAIKILGIERGIPLSKTAVTVLTADGTIKEDDPIVAGLKLAQSLPGESVATPYIEDFQILAKFAAARENIDYGKQTVEQAAEDFESQVNRILRRLQR